MIFPSLLSESGAVSKNGGLRVGGGVAGQMAFLLGDASNLRLLEIKMKPHAQTQASENLLAYTVKHSSE